MKKLYLVFPYEIDDQQYMEAYPVHGYPYPSKYLPDDMPYTHVMAVSRNQARKAGHSLFAFLIKDTNKGFGNSYRKIHKSHA
tara:strand:- start:1199 stop:1444 length:246 start_codon:yes stop_codon:yes gene_type:complete